MLAIATALALPVPASAGSLLSSLGGACPTDTLGQPFKPWLDYAHYRLAPGGSFEATQSSWTLAGGAKVVSGNEPWYVNSDRDRRSLQVPGGGSAQSPATCVTLDEPTIRFFARASKTSLTSQLLVYALTEDASGTVVTTLVGTLSASSSWRPTPIFPLVLNLLAVLPDGQAPVAFRLVATGSASWFVDDFYVDPKRR